MNRRPNPVVYADEQVAITTACRLIGMQIPEAADLGRPVKVHCPFGEIYHRDRGTETAFRIYPDSNHAYCFACGQRYGPVRLVSLAWGISARNAAVELLERAGIKPVTLADLWAQVADHAPVPDTAMLAEALKTYCARIDPGWDAGQFDPATAATLSGCLVLLDHVSTAGDAQLWLTRTKQVMSARLTTVDDGQHLSVW